MAFHPKDNPLKDVKVKMPSFCKDKKHLSMILIRGKCPTCKKETITLV